jgi:peptidoglycan/LPS O-acetylase OafA/YrhL
MSEQPTPPNKLLGLEALRFIAAFSVLVWHYQHFAYVADVPVDLVRDRLPLSGLLRPLYEVGQYGVWVFWCVSGFIFFWKYRDSIFERSMPPWTFFVFRLSRLYPLHFATLIIVAALQLAYFRWHGYFFVYQDNDLRHFLLQIFMASNWGFESGNSFNGPIWSISVEVLVYVMFFLMLRFVTRSAVLNLVVILVCLNFSGQIFTCLAFFYAGGLAAIVRRATASATFGGAIERVGWSAAVLAPVAMWLLRSQFGLTDRALLLTCTPLFLFCLSRQVAVSRPIQTWLEAAGNMTYSSYLAQFPIQVLVALGFAMSGNPVPFYDTWFFLTFVGSTLLISFLTYRYFEAPAQALLRFRLLPAPAAPADATALAIPAAGSMRSHVANHR